MSVWLLRLAQCACASVCTGFNLCARTFPNQTEIDLSYTSMWLRPDYQTLDTLCFRRKSKTNNDQRKLKKKRRTISSAAMKRARKSYVKPKARHVHFASIFMFISSSEWAFGGCRSCCFPCPVHFFFASSHSISLSLLLIYNSISFRVHESALIVPSFIIFTEFIVRVGRMSIGRVTHSASQRFVPFERARFQVLGSNQYLINGLNIIENWHISANTRA